MKREKGNRGKRTKEKGEIEEEKRKSGKGGKQKRGKRGDKRKGNPGKRQREKGENEKRDQAGLNKATLKISSKISCEFSLLRVILFLSNKILTTFKLPINCFLFSKTNRFWTHKKGDNNPPNNSGTPLAH